MGAPLLALLRRSMLAGWAGEEQPQPQPAAAAAEGRAVVSESARAGAGGGRVADAPFVPGQCCAHTIG